MIIEQYSPPTITLTQFIDYEFRPEPWILKYQIRFLDWRDRMIISIQSTLFVLGISIVLILFLLVLIVDAVDTYLSPRRYSI